MTGGVAAPAWRLTGAGLGLVGCAALLARPWALRLTADPTMSLIILFVVLGTVGAVWPVMSGPRSSSQIAVLALVVGIGALVVARVAIDSRPVTAAVASTVALNSLTALAEEAFFRRLLYGLLAPFGAALAVVGSAVAFALVHVTVWGIWVLPIDLAVGLVLSWQRWASGRWSVPALTHVAANVLAVV